MDSSSIIGKIFIGILVIFIACLIEGVIVMWLWNWLLTGDNSVLKPVVEGFRQISWVEGFGLALLGNALFGSVVRTNKNN